MAKAKTIVAQRSESRSVLGQMKDDMWSQAQGRSYPCYSTGRAGTKVGEIRVSPILPYLQNTRIAAKQHSGHKAAKATCVAQGGNKPRPEIATKCSKSPGARVRTAEFTGDQRKCSQQDHASPR